MRVLYVATDLRDADILHQEVRRVAPGLSMEICAGLSELRARPDQSPAPDVLLMDCSLSEAEQLQLIHYARVRQLGVPVVGVMGASTSMPSAALTAGLDDLLVRGPKFAERLQPALRLSTERCRTVNQTQRENDKLKRSEARLRLIIEALPTGVVLLEQQGKVLAMNAAGVQLFGSVSPQEIVGRSFQTMLPVEDQPAFQDFLKKTSSGEEASFQFQSQAHEGDTPHVFSLRGLCIQRDDSGQTAVLGVLDRVTVGGSTAHHAWTPDFNLDSAGLTPPLLDMGSPGIDPAVLAEAEKRATDQEARAQNAEGRAHHAEARIAELDAEIAKLRAAHDAAETRAATMQQQLAQAQEQHAQVSVDLGNARHETNNVRQELLYEQERRAAAEALAQSHASSAANAAAEDLAKHTEALAMLAGELETARGEIGSLMESVSRERHEKEHAQASLALVESQIQGQSGQTDAMRAELSAVADELAKARAAAEALQAANQQLQAAALEQQAQQGHQHEQQQAHHQSMQQAHHAEMEAIRAELASTAAALAEQREAHDQLQASIARKDAQVADLEQRAASRIIELEKEHRVAVDRLQELLDQAVKDSQANNSRGADSARRGAERVGRLAAAMAADLNAAAEAAGEAARAVINAVPQGAHGHEHAAKTLETVSRCTELSRHLLRMSTRYMGQQTRTDISHLVRQQEALLQHLAGPDIELQFELTAGLSSVELDAQDLTQVLTSLTVTARDALPLGGAIKITTTTQRHDAEAGARNDHPRPLVLAVTARGYGIRPVSSATCEDVTARCGGLLTTVIEPNVSWTLMAMLPGLSSDLESLTRSA